VSGFLPALSLIDDIRDISLLPSVIDTATTAYDGPMHPGNTANVADTAYIRGWQFITGRVVRIPVADFCV
jgi:hypothetical protein